MAAATAAERFDIAASSGSEEGWTDAELATAGRQVKLRRFRQGAVFAAVLLGVAAVVSTLVVKHQGPAAAKDSAVEMKATIKPFQQCGGKNWMKGGCCQEGCACIVKSPFYSMCAAPEGVGECDKREAKGMADLMKMRMKAAPPKVKRAKAALKEAQKKENEAREVLEKKTKVADELAKKGDKAKSSKVAKLKAAKEAKEKADDASKAAADKKAEWQKEQTQSDNWESAEAKRTSGAKCGMQYQTCTGPAGCCVEGCLCVEKKAGVYSQCVAPAGSGTCNPTFEIKARVNSKKRADKLRKESEELDAKSKKLNKHANVTKEAADKAVAEAAKAGTARVKSRHEKEKHAHIVKKLQQTTHEKEQDLAEAKSLIVNGPKNAKAWQKVVDGTACEADDSDLDLDDIDTSGDLGDDDLDLDDLDA